MAEEQQNEGVQSLSIANEEVASVFRNLPDEVLQQFSFPLFSPTSSPAPRTDADGFPEISQDNLSQLKDAQQECWRLAESNPQISSHIRDVMGRMAGWGFGFSSGVHDVNKVIEEVMEDPRNDLYQAWPKFCARSEIEGELFLMLTVHDNGFIEVDFIAPSSVTDGGDKSSGIIFHPTKQSFPLFFVVQMDTTKNDMGTEHETILVPSINVAYYPDLEKEVKDHQSYDSKKLEHSKAPRSKRNNKPYKQFNGYKRFMLHWNKGYMTRRNVSHIKTTIEWVNYYESLKKYEIDHKKSSGAYLWVVKMENPQAFRNWVNMSEEQRKKTGIMQPKDPGGTLVLPPGMTVEVQNPKLSAISDQDTDIMQMVSSGLQKPQDVMLGDYRSTYASVKASQGPQGDRINDELHYFKMFLIYSFWRPILWLRSKIKRDFPYMRKVNKVTGFKDQEEIVETVYEPCYKFVDVNLPVSRLEDIEATATALLGSKHGSIVDTLGIPRKRVAQRLGFSDYDVLRKEKAEEDRSYPETLSALNQEQVQEKAEGEPSREKEERNKKRKVDRKKKKEE